MAANGVDAPDCSMRTKAVVCRFLALLAISLGSARAAVLYVSTSGSDSNPGTVAAPFRTITYAYSKAGAGTTILVAPGTYADYTSGWGLHLGSSGTASSPIVLESQVRGGAVIDGQNASDRNEGIYIDGSYNVVEGFEIKNGPNGGISIWGNGNQILNCEIDHNGNPAYTGTNGHDGLYEDQSLSGNVFAGNYIHDNGRTGGSNLDHGMYLCGSGELVVNNVSIRNDSSGLQIAGYTTVSNMKVYNNVFAWNGSEGVIIWMNMSGVDIKNNIIYDNAIYGVHYYAATGSGVVIDHNLVYGNGTANYDTPGDGGGTISVTMGSNLSSDPKFANETQSSFDAHLASGSPAIGAGYNFYSTFTTDLAETARPSSGAWDLGAYAYSGVSSLGLPAVTAAATAPTASRAGLTNGVITLTRTGDTSAPLTVNYSLGGTATNGVDYAATGASLIIPTGAASSAVVVAPLPSASYAGMETVTLTLSASSLYALGPATNAEVAINGNSVPSSLKVTGAGAAIQWASVTGKVYRVAYKASLSDTTWTNLSSLITASGATASYTDTAAGKHSTRYYLVYVTD